MTLLERLRRAGRTGPAGVVVRVRRPAGLRGGGGRRIPAALLWVTGLAALFYVAAHISIILDVWPVHGAAPGAEGMLLRDAAGLFAWLALLPVLRRMGYAGSWLIIALPVVIFLLTRPSLFHAFTDPVYQATAETRAEANTLKAERARLSTVLRAYDGDRQQVVFGGAADAVPNSVWRAEYGGGTDARPWLARMLSHTSIFLAPLALIAGFVAARRSNPLRRLRDRRLWPFGVTLGFFFVLALFFVERGRVAGTTPWELFLPLFVGVWAAVLADDSYNLARPRAAFRPARMLNLLAYGALPLVPFLLIRELGLSVVLAATLAVMLLVGTRRGWWAGLMIAVWSGLIVTAFSLDHRSATRLELAYDPYHDPAEMSAEAAEAWAVRLHQFKLFDANVLAGGVLGPGAGRGHGETAPNAADDGFITLFAAQFGWSGAVALVVVYTLFLTGMLTVAIRERGAFERSLITGLALLIAISFWMAVLGGIRVVPLTGVVSAFAAHGGTKLLASAVSVGVIAGISHRRSTEPHASDENMNPVVESLSGASHHGVRIR